MGGMGGMGGMPAGFSDGSGRTFVFNSSGGMPGGMGNMDPHDIFAQLFGDDDLSGFGGMGGMGAMGGMGGMSGMGGMGGMGQGHRKQRRRQSPSKAPHEVTHTLPCSLDELYKGTMKRIKITNNTGASNVLEIGVQPGWKKGTKVRFANEGDTLNDGSVQDVVFLIDEKPHGWFERHGDDLHYKAKLSAQQARKGVKVTIPTLDGRQVKLETTAVANGKKKVFKGEGMPKRSGGKGDMVVEFRVDQAAASA